jgi:hypothetical protein
MQNHSDRFVVPDAESYVPRWSRCVQPATLLHTLLVERDGNTPVVAHATLSGE